MTELESLADCIEPDSPTRGEVGYVGDDENLREYPCNCTRCRGVTDDRETYHDGETPWCRCIFCARHFELEDTEPVLAAECPYVAADSQACVRCAEGWKQSCRAERAEADKAPTPPGALTIPSFTAGGVEYG